MQIGARTALWSGGAKPWVNPYITDGLIAMWDGEWNAGGGVHDGQSGKIIPVVGSAGLTFELSDYGEIGEKSIICKGTSYAAYSSGYLLTSDVLTLEVCCRRDVTNMVIVDLGGARANTIKMMGISSNNYPFIVAFSNAKSQSGYHGSAPYNIGTFVALRESSSVVVPSYFKDGAVLTQTSGTTYSYPTQSAPRAMSLGAEVEGTKAWIGEIYCVRAYSRALTADEIAANYAVDKARFGLT